VGRGSFTSYFVVGILILAGFSGIWVSYSQGSFQWLPFVVGAVFLGFGIYLLALLLTRSKAPSGTAGTMAQNYVAERILLAQTARDYYIDKLLRHKSPDEFDQQMLWLFDAIELGQPDIHERIEAIRDYTRRKGFFASWNDRFKARIVWQHGAAYLRWRRAGTDENWHLYTNWNRLYRIGNQTWAGADVTIPDRWVDLAPPVAADMPQA
jgi:hypothetical protein